MTHKHPEDLPVTEYYRLNGVNFTYCWRAGCTSIASLALNAGAEILSDPPETCILLLKEPMSRFASAWCILPDGLQRREEGNVIARQSIEDYTDGVLDDVEGVRSPHCWRQLEQHSDVKHLVLYRLEGTTHIAGTELLHLNETEEPKPELTHRVDELREFYAEDIAAWEAAQIWKQ